MVLSTNIALTPMKFVTRVTEIYVALVFTFAYMDLANGFFGNLRIRKPKSQ